MYRYYATKRNPVSMWMLDDPTPFQEFTGNDAVADASGSPAKAAPLVAGAAYSTVFDSAATGRFSCNLFQRGKEENPFALEAWVLPIERASGFAARNLVRNIATGGIESNLNATRTATTWKGVSWSRAESTGPSGGIRMSLPLVELIPNEMYTLAFTVANPGTSPINMSVDWSDSLSTAFSVDAGKVRRLTMNVSREEYNSVYRFIDITTTVVGNIFLLREVTVVAGADQQATYFDGSATFPEHSWEGGVGSVSRTSPEIALANMLPSAVPLSGSGWVNVDVATKAITGTNAYSPNIASPTGSDVTSVAVLRNPTDAPIAVSLNSRTTGEGLFANGHSGPLDSRTVQPGERVVMRAKSSVYEGETGFRLGFAGGVGLILESALGTNSNYDGPVFDGNTPGAYWTGTANASPSVMLVSAAPQKVLSHSNSYDGLSINGSVVRFGTEYLNSGDAYCEYDLGETKLAHIVGTHNKDQNQLWVNGEVVAEVDLTDEQRGDVYRQTETDWLYCGGATGSSQNIAVNAIAAYHNISGDDIVRNYAAGVEFIGQDKVYSQLGGTPFDLNYGNGAVFFEDEWVNFADFSQGLKSDVEYGPEKVLPAYEGGISLPGSWTVGIPLDAQEDDSIYGVMVSWSGLGISADVSLDGLSWTPAKSGRLVDIIAPGFNPTGKDLQIRVNFGGGLTNDPSYLESLRVVGFRDNSVENITGRPVSVTHPAVVRNDFEPNLYRDDNGIRLNGGSLVIGADTTPDPDVSRTLELWIKPISGTPTISVAGTKYRNGVADTTLPLGQWSLVHIVAAADIGAITVSGDAILGQASLYPTPLTAAEVDYVWRAYTGRTAIRVTDNNSIGFSTKASPVAIYASTWAIDSAG